MKELLEYKLWEIGGYIITVWSLLSVFLIYVGAHIVIFLLTKIFRRFALRKQMDTGRQTSFLILMRYFIWIFAISMMFSAMQIQLTFLLASSAALLVGIGLGLQQVFSDIVSGIFLLFEGTIEVGDVLEVDGTVGRVEKIGLRTTIFRNRDDMIVIIPNHKFVAEKVVNWSHNNTVTRFIVNVSVSYNSDMDLVKKVLLDTVVLHDDVITDQSEMQPTIRMADFQDSGVLFEVLFYSENMFRIESSKSDIRFLIWDAFKKHQIQIPYPQMDVHLYQK